MARSSCLAALLGCLALPLCLAGFTFRISEDLGTLDWGNGEVAYPVVQQLMEGLTTSGARGEAVAALASSWSARDGGRRFVFTIRDTARWSDGKPVCAQDFVDAWLRVLSPEFGSPYAHYLYDLKGARAFRAGSLKDPSRVGARARGCARLEVELEHPAAYFPVLASHWVLSPVRRELIARFGPRWTDPANLVVTGPYVLAEWSHDKALVLRRNPRYWGAPALEDRLLAQVVGDDTTAVNLFRAGKLDWMRDVPYLEKAALAATPEYSTAPSLIEYHLGFSFAEGKLDREARCALAAAIDKNAIPALLKGAETPADRLVPRELAPAAPATAPAFDAAGARALWARSSAAGKPLELHYYAKDVHEPLAQYLQEQWKKNLGAEVRLVKTEGKTYWARLGEKAPPLFLSGTTAAYAHPYAFLSEFLSESRANWGHFSSAEYDGLARRAAAEPAARAEGASVAAQRLLLERECAVIPLYFRATAALTARGWTGIATSPMSYIYFKAVRRR